jgi:predicted Zn-ribbon and HTH transcriptional regulator
MAQQNTQRIETWWDARARRLGIRTKPRYEREGYIVKKAAVPQKKAVKCGHCDYEWTPRVDIPKQCPRCKRYLVW